MLSLAHSPSSWQSVIPASLPLTTALTSVRTSTALALRLRQKLSPHGMFVFTNECFREGFPCKTDGDCIKQGSGAGPATCREHTCHDKFHLRDPERGDISGPRQRDFRDQGGHLWN